MYIRELPFRWWAIISLAISLAFTAMVSADNSPGQRPAANLTIGAGDPPAGGTMSLDGTAGAPQGAPATTATTIKTQNGSPLEVKIVGQDGNPGPQGARGNNGARDHRGQRGYLGKQGPEGKVGPQGPAGPAGKDADPRAITDLQKQVSELKEKKADNGLLWLAAGLVFVTIVGGVTYLATIR